MFIITLFNSATLNLMMLRAPAYITIMDVDAFIKELCYNTTPNPLIHTAILI